MTATILRLTTPATWVCANTRSTPATCGDAHPAGHGYAYSSADGHTGPATYCYAFSHADCHTCPAIYGYAYADAYADAYSDTDDRYSGV